MAMVLRNSGQRSLPKSRWRSRFRKESKCLLAASDAAQDVRTSGLWWLRPDVTAQISIEHLAKEGWPSTSILGKPRWRSSTMQERPFCEGQPSAFHFGCHWDAHSLCASGCFLSTPRSEVRREPRHRQGGPSETWSCQTSLRANEETHFSESCPASIWTNCAFSKPHSFPIAVWERDMVRTCQNYRQLHSGSSKQWLLTATGRFEILGVGLKRRCPTRTFYPAKALSHFAFFLLVTDLVILNILPSMAWHCCLARPTSMPLLEANYPTSPTALHRNVLPIKFGSTTTTWYVS